MTAIAQTKFTLEEYFDLEFISDVKHEFIDGKIRPMAYTSIAHGRIVQNVSRLLGNCLLETNYEPFSGDRMTYVAACNRIYYPDLVVLPIERETLFYKGKMEAEKFPVSVIEVLSKSTSEDDFGDKWDCYQTIPSLEQYVLIDQYKVKIHTYQRIKNTNKWVYELFDKMEASFVIKDCPLKIQDVYARVKFEVVE